MPPFIGPLTQEQAVRKRLQELRTGVGAVSTTTPPINSSPRGTQLATGDIGAQVRARLAQLRAKTAPPVAPVVNPPQQRGFFDTIVKPLSNTGMTLGAEIGKTGLGLGQATLAGASHVAGRIGLPSAKQFLGQAAGEVGGLSKKIFTDPYQEQLATPSGKIGQFLGTAASYLAPTGEIAGAQKFLTGLVPKLPTILGRAATAGTSLLARAVPEAIGTGAVELARTGGNTEEAKKAGLIAGGASVVLGAAGGLIRSVFGNTPLEQSVTKALGLNGKTTAGRLAPQIEKKVAGLKILSDMAPEIKVLDEAGVAKTFNPKTATFGETVQAWNQARKSVFNQYHQLAVQAGDKATVDFSKAVNLLEDIQSSTRTSAYKSSARGLLDDIKRNFAVIDENGKIVGWKPSTPEQVEQYLADLNNEAAAAIAGKGRTAAGDVAADTAAKIRTSLDDAIEKAGGVGYGKLKGDYSALKAIENDLVNRFKQEARRLGSGVGDYFQAFNSGDIIAGALTSNPQLFLSGLARGTLGTAIRAGRTPQRFLRRSFSQLEGGTTSDLSTRLFGGGSSPLTKQPSILDNVPQQFQTLVSKAGQLTGQDVTPHLKSMFPQANDASLSALADEISKIKSPEALAKFLSEKLSFGQVMARSVGSEAAQTAKVQRLIRQAQETGNLREGNSLLETLRGNKQAGFARNPFARFAEEKGARASKSVTSTNDKIASNIDELIGETNKPQAGGKIDVDAMEILHDMKDKLAKGENLSPAETRLYNIMTKGLKREDLAVNTPRSKWGIEEIPKGEGGIPKTTFTKGERGLFIGSRKINLTQEVRKYESAEEFVKAQNTSGLSRLQEVAQNSKSYQEFGDKIGAYIDYQGGKIEKFRAIYRNALGIKGDVARGYQFPKLTEVDSEVLKGALGFDSAKSIPKELTVYRGIDPRTPVNRAIMSGDYVTLSKESAKNYGAQVQELKVKPEDLRFIRGNKMKGTDEFMVVTKGTKVQKYPFDSELPSLEQFYNDAIATKSQLTDLYNQITGSKNRRYQ